MEVEKVVEKGGVYCCLYHQKNKIKLKSGSTFPECNFAGLTCQGNWHLLREIKEKTREEIAEERNRKRQQQNKSRGRDKEFFRRLREPKFNKWDLDQC